MKTFTISILDTQENRDELLRNFISPTFCNEILSPNRVTIIGEYDSYLYQVKSSSHDWAIVKSFIDKFKHPHNLNELVVTNGS